MGMVLKGRAYLITTEIQYSRKLQYCKSLIFEATLAVNTKRAEILFAKFQYSVANIFTLFYINRLNTLLKHHQN